MTKLKENEMARLHINIPQGGRIDAEYAQRLYEQISDKVTKRIVTTKLSDA